MKKVIIIDEENHGVIGVAENLLGAIAFIIEHDWLCGYEIVEFKGENVSLDELQERFHLNSTFETVVYCLHEDENLLEYLFHFTEAPLWEYNPK